MLCLGVPKVTALGVVVWVTIQLIPTLSAPIRLLQQQLLQMLQILRAQIQLHNKLQPFYESAPFIEALRLKSLSPEDPINLRYAFDCAKETVDANGSQTMLLKANIDGCVMREISEVYRAKTDAEI